MKRIKNALLGAVILASMSLSAQAAVSLKSSGDQWGPAIADLMNSNENGNWNESRFISTFNSRFNGTADEAKALLSALKSGNVPSSSDSFNATLPSTGGGSSNPSSGVSQSDFEKDQKRQDDETAKNKADQADIDKGQNTAIDKAQDAGDKGINDAYNAQQTANTAVGVGQDAKNTAINAQNTADYAVGLGQDNSNRIINETNDRISGDAALQADIDKNKVDQASRDKGQDDHINAVQGAAQTANEHADRLDIRADGLSDSIKETNAQLEVTDGRSINNAKRLDGVEQKNVEQDVAIASKVDKTIFKADQDRQDAALASETKSRIAGDEYTNYRVDQANANIEANHQALVSTNKAVAQNTADIANHEQRIQGLERSTNARFANMDKRINDNKQKADAAVAGVAAMANIPQVTESARFSLGAGVGTRGSQQALAVGMSSRLSDSVVGKLSVANDTESQWTAGVGIAVQW